VPIIDHRAATGLDLASVHTHRKPDWWRRAGRTPAADLLTEPTRAAVAGYIDALRRLAALEQGAADLNDRRAERRALAEDEATVAAAAPGDVTTPALDRLFTARRTNVVARGAAALVADRALEALEAARRAPGALDLAAGARAAKARARALKTLADLEPLLAEVAVWDAAVRWTRGEPAAPDHDPQHLAEAIARAIREEA